MLFNNEYIIATHYHKHIVRLLRGARYGEIWLSEP